MDKICGIYKITSPSGKIYIGQTKNIHRRIQRYKYGECFQQPKINNSIIKYGWDKHIFEIIHECDYTELDNLEKYYIKLFNTFNTEHGMNLTEGGDSTVFTEETKNKISKSKLGIKRSEKTKQRISKTKKDQPKHINFIHSSGEYEIYDNKKILICRCKSNIKEKFKELNLPSYSFCRSYRNNTKISKGLYEGWYVTKL